MSIVPDYLDLAARVCAQLEPPRITRIALPEPSTAPDIRDDFGLVILDSGVVAPFYASLPGALAELWQHYPIHTDISLSLPEIISRMGSPEPAASALALGGFNALGQHLMRQAAFLPLGAQASSNLGSLEPAPGDRVGMVGYFRRLVDKLLARGCQVLVIERQPQRVESQPGLVVSEDPADLASCGIVLCTAATLINDSLDEILAHRDPQANFSLIGPSGSGLPDILFARGVDAVGGVYFPEYRVLDERLSKRESWGDAGQKYQLTPANYPGYPELLQRLAGGN